MAFFILYEGYMNTPLTDIHASGPAILILGYQIVNALVFAKFPCEKCILLWKKNKSIYTIS